MSCHSFRLEIDGGYNWKTGKCDPKLAGLVLIVDGEPEAQLPLTELRDALKALESK